MQSAFKRRLTSSLERQEWLEAAVEALRDKLHRPAAGPRLFVLKVKPENPPRSLPPRDAVFLKNRFRAHLGLPVT